MKRTAYLMLTLICGFLSADRAAAVNIVWVTPNAPGPSAAAQAVGFTEAPDIGYTNMLTAAGHSVTRLLTQATGNNTALPAGDLTTMNAADLVIISRSANSGIVDNVLEINSWNTQVTKPVIIMSGNFTRNNRLGLTTGTTTADITGSTRLKALVPNSPIFQGVTLDANNETGEIMNLVTAPIPGNPV